MRAGQASTIVYWTSPSRTERRHRNQIGLGVLFGQRHIARIVRRGLGRQQRYDRPTENGSQLHSSPHHRLPPDTPLTGLTHGHAVSTTLPVRPSCVGQSLPHSQRTYARRQLRKLRPAGSPRSAASPRPRRRPESAPALPRPGNGRARRRRRGGRLRFRGSRRAAPS